MKAVYTLKFRPSIGQETYLLGGSTDSGAFIVPCVISNCYTWAAPMIYN